MIRAMFRFSAWLTGLLFTLIGLVNVFWGNDPVFGVFLIVLSAVFYPHVLDAVRQRLNMEVPVWLRLLLALTILWMALGVGELPEKLGMMTRTFGIG